MEEIIKMLLEGITPQFNILCLMMRSGEQVPSLLQVSRATPELSKARRNAAETV